MIKKSCCIIGQKIINYEKQDDVFEEVFKQIERLIKQGCREFIFGGQGQFDNTARLAVRILSMGKYPNIKTIYY